MAIKITDDCINCGACEPECPNGAIFENGGQWNFAYKTEVKGLFTGKSGITAEAEADQAPLSDDYYYIVTDKCTECVGFHDEPQCASVCPVDCCVPDPDAVESKEELIGKKEVLHP